MNIKIKLPKVTLFGIDVIKNILLFSLFIVVFLFLLAVLVAPSIRYFKTQKIQYSQLRVESDKTDKQLTKISTKYKKLFRENRKTIFALKRDFKKDSFKNFAKKYMEIIDIEDRNSSIYQKKFIKKTYIVTASLDTPINFYRFVDDIKNYKNVLKVYFPIVFKAKNGKLKLLFKMEHFKTRK
jgi:hypothetical protein